MDIGLYEDTAPLYPTNIDIVVTDEFLPLDWSYSEFGLRVPVGSFFGMKALVHFTHWSSWLLIALSAICDISSLDLCQ